MQLFVEKQFVELFRLQSTSGAAALLGYDEGDLM